jgi:putative transposase
MLRIAAGVASLICDGMRWLWLTLRSTSAVEAENLFLRRQLALYVERGAKPRRIDSVTRIALTILSGFFAWQDALVVVCPQTLLRWHRQGWKLFWRLKSRPNDGMPCDASRNHEQHS